MVCLDRLPTLSRLASFGIEVDTACLLCVGGVEHSDHLFLQCIYSHHVLELVCTRVHVPLEGTLG